MSSHLSRAVVLTALVLAGCGSSSSGDCTTGICALVPASGEVSGWTRSGELKTWTNATVLLPGGLDGGAHPFVEAGLVQVALQNFINGTAGLELRVWQMNDTATATSIYTNLPTVYPSTYKLTWSIISAGTEGRLANTGGYYFLNSHKGAYHVEVTTTVGSSTTSDQATTFIQAVMAKIQ